MRFHVVLSRILKPLTCTAEFKNLQATGFGFSIKPSSDLLSGAI
jgi:hypothetical protein